MIFLIPYPLYFFPFSIIFYFFKNSYSCHNQEQQVTWRVFNWNFRKVFKLVYKLLCHVFFKSTIVIIQKSFPKKIPLLSNLIELYYQKTRDTKWKILPNRTAIIRSCEHIINLLLSIFFSLHSRILSDVRCPLKPFLNPVFIFENKLGLMNGVVYSYKCVKKAIKIFLMASAVTGRYNYSGFFFLFFFFF